MAQILDRASTFTILNPTEKEIVKFPCIVEVSGRTCYQSLREDSITFGSGDKFVRQLIRNGHESVLEHCSITVRFENCSRGFTHEIVRHRVGIGFSQESTRYVDERDLHFVIPPGMDPDIKIEGSWLTPREVVEFFEQYYRLLLESGYKKQDARQFLPIGTTSEIVVTANLREWRHIFGLRLHKAAHWEMRGIMTKLWFRFNQLLPCVFEEFKEMARENLSLLDIETQTHMSAYFDKFANPPMDADGARLHILFQPTLPTLEPDLNQEGEPDGE